MLQKTILILAVAALLLTASTGYAIHTPIKMWDYALGGSNVYYGSGVFNGQWHTGKISYGPLAYDNDDTNTPAGNPYMADQYYDSDGTIGDKSIVPLNGYMYVGASSNAGIYQLDSDWTNQLPSGSYMGAAQGSESIVTDGTYLYGNDDYVRGNIHRYTVTSGATPSVTATLIATIPGAPRVRGISYNAHFDELYVGDHQQGTIYKITDPSGTPALVAIGTSVDSNGDGEYQAERYGSGNELFVVGEVDATAKNFVIYDLNPTTGLIIPGSEQIIDLGLGNCYGLGLEGNGRDAMGMWVSSINAHVSYWELRHNGDADMSGAVNVTDLGALATAYGLLSGQQWTDGDFDGDGDVDVSDLGALATEYGWTAPAAAAVPEPATLSMLVLGALALLLQRRRK